MAILLIAEHDDQSLSDQTAKALTAALKIGPEVDILVAGKDAKAAAEAAAKLAGVRKVLVPTPTSWPSGWPSRLPRSLCRWPATTTPWSPLPRRPART